MSSTNMNRYFPEYTWYTTLWPEGGMKALILINRPPTTSPRLTVLSICTEGQKARTSTPSSHWGSSESCGHLRPLNDCPSWRYSNPICHPPTPFWDKKKNQQLGPRSYVTDIEFIMSQMLLHYHFKGDYTNLFLSTAIKMENFSCWLLQLCVKRFIDSLYFPKHILFKRHGHRHSCLIKSLRRCILSINSDTEKSHTMKNFTLLPQSHTLVIALFWLSNFVMMNVEFIYPWLQQTIQMDMAETRLWVWK